MDGHKFTDDQFLEKILECKDGKNYEILESYKGTHTAIRFKHKKCGREFLMRPNNFIIKGNRCPLCAEDEHDKRKGTIHSKSEEIIAEYLKSKNIKFEREVKFKETGNLRFDFKVYLNDENYFLVEYDGRFHRKPKEGCSELTLKKYESQVKNDKRKNKFCKDNNIILIRSTNVNKMIKLISNKFNDYPISGENPQQE